MSTILTKTIRPEVPSETQKLSLLHGPVDPPLVDLTLGELLELQTYQHGTRECLVIPWTGARWTYNELNQQSSWLAQSLLDMGLGVGDRVGIMAGNCEQYAAVFFAAAKIGAILVILNNTYTPTEAMYGIQFSECKIVFTTPSIGRMDNTRLLGDLDNLDRGPKVIMLRGEAGKYTTYDDLIKVASRKNHDKLYEAMRRVSPHQVVNLQFTSGTTGLPKAAMLTHQYASTSLYMNINLGRKTNKLCLVTLSITRASLVTGCASHRPTFSAARHLSSIASALFSDS